LVVFSEEQIFKHTLQVRVIWTVLKP
jgi:hypothetical protein